MSTIRTRLVATTRLLVGAYFRRVEVTGLEHVPTEGGGVVVSWHPNGMIDPTLILSFFPRKLVFGARDGLFRWPILGAMMRGLDTVPIFRAEDATGESIESRRQANQKSLDLMAKAVTEGAFACLFPEGVSHDAPHPMAMKGGAARLFLQACATTTADTVRPVIVPVGLHYSHKATFRSQALVAFHPPIALPGTGPDEKQLTALIESTLHDAIHATESWALHNLMHEARKLVRAERSARANAAPGAPSMEERTLGMARIWEGYRARQITHPREVSALQARIESYQLDLDALGIESHHLDRAPTLFSWWMAAILVAQVILVFLLLPPLLLVGYAVNGPPFVLLGLVTRMFAKEKKDEASVKLGLGFLLFPTCWALAGLAGMQLAIPLNGAYPSLPDAGLALGVSITSLGVLGGILALRYLHLSRSTLRSVRVRLTRARSKVALARLRVERAELHDAVLGLAQGLDLPGEVGPDGRILAE